MERKAVVPALATTSKPDQTTTAEILCDHRPHSETYQSARKFRFLFHDVRDMVALSNTNDAAKILSLKHKLLTRVLGKSFSSPEENGRFANTYYPLGVEKRLVQKGIFFLESNTYGLFKPCGLVAHAKFPWIAVATRGMLQLSNNEQARQVFRRAPGVEQHSVWFHLDTKKDDEIIDSDMERIKSTFAYEIQYTMLVTGTSICVVVLVRQSNSRLVTVTADRGVFNNLTAMIMPWKTEWLEWKWSSKGDASSKDRCVKTLIKDNPLEEASSDAHKWLLSEADNNVNLKQFKTVSVDYNPRTASDEQVPTSMPKITTSALDSQTMTVATSLDTSKTKQAQDKVVANQDDSKKTETVTKQQDGAKSDEPKKKSKDKKKDKKKTKGKHSKHDSDLDTDSDASDDDGRDSDAEKTRRKNKRKHKRDKAKSKKRDADSDSESEDDGAKTEHSSSVKSETKDMDETDDQIKQKGLPVQERGKQTDVVSKPAETPRLEKKKDKHTGKKRRRRDSDEDDDEKEEEAADNVKGASKNDESKTQVKADPAHQVKTKHAQDQEIDIVTKDDSDDEEMAKKRRHKKQKREKHKVKKDKKDKQDKRKKNKRDSDLDSDSD